MLTPVADAPQVPSRRSNVFKLALIGSPHAGKTTFAQQFCDGYSSDQYSPHVTLEAYCGRTKTGQRVYLYEVPGQNQYIELYDLSAQRLAGLVFIYCDYIAATYTRLDYLVSFCKKYGLENLPGLIVRNTCTDRALPSEPRPGPDFAQSFGYEFMEMNLLLDRDKIHEAVQLFLR